MESLGGCVRDFRPSKVLFTHGLNRRHGDCVLLVRPAQSIQWFILPVRWALPELMKFHFLTCTISLSRGQQSGRMVYATELDVIQHHGEVQGTVWAELKMWPASDTDPADCARPSCYWLESTTLPPDGYYCKLQGNRRSSILLHKMHYFAKISIDYYDIYLLAFYNSVLCTLISLNIQ